MSKLDHREAVAAVHSYVDKISADINRRAQSCTDVDISTVSSQTTDIVHSAIEKIIVTVAGRPEIFTEVLGAFVRDSKMLQYDITMVSLLVASGALRKFAPVICTVEQRSLMEEKDAPFVRVAPCWTEESGRAPSMISII